MKCGIVNCAQGDNRYLWRCHGICNRTFHAACIGAQRNHEEILRTFMLPLCQDCQEKFVTDLNLKALTSHLRNISENIGKTLEVNHKLLSNYKNLSATHDNLLEHIEKSLNEIKLTITNAASSNKASAAEIKNKMSTLLDTHSDTSAAVEAMAKSAATAAAAAATNSTTGSINKLLATIETGSAQSNADSALREILDEVKFVSGAITSLQINQTSASQQHKSLHEELNQTLAANNKATKPITDHSSPGWRFLGNKWRWMPDWSDYDARQRTRRLQEKAAEKSRRNRKRRRRQYIESKNFNNNRNHTTNSNSNKTTNSNYINNNHKFTHTYQNDQIRVNGSDKQLLATAKVKFARPPSTIDHPIAGLAVPNFINFRKGETINPYRSDNQNQHNIESPPNENTTSKATLESHPTSWSLDPMRPPVVNLTQQSAVGDGCFLKARLRDPKIMHLVRLYLAYMHDKDPTVCYDGMTKTSIQITLASEGLPVAAEELRKFFFEVHEEFGVPKQAASEDLNSYSRHLNNQRIQSLQRARESADKFYRPIFRK